LLRNAALTATCTCDCRNLHYPALIVKALVPSGPRSFIMAVNESSASKRGFDILMRFLNPRDSLLLVHFTHPLKLDPTLTHSKNQIKNYFEKELLEVAPPNSRFEFVEYAMGVPPADAIVDYVNSAPCDVFAIAPRASRDRSSVTESVVNNIKVSVLLCKN
jgi:nucleotide-binding universal stress UspA family protein